jgi:hypothetical protein
MAQGRAAAFIESAPFWMVSPTIVARTAKALIGVTSNRRQIGEKLDRL